MLPMTQKQIHGYDDRALYSWDHNLATRKLEAPEKSHNYDYMTCGVALWRKWRFFLLDDVLLPQYSLALPWKRACWAPSRVQVPRYSSIFGMCLWTSGASSSKQVWEEYSLATYLSLLLRLKAGLKAAWLVSYLVGPVLSAILHLHLQV